MRWSLCLTAALLSVAAGCRPATESTGRPTPGGPVTAADDLSAARLAFSTKLRARGPAPQPYQNAEPPVGVKRVEFTSGDLRLKGWLSADAHDGKKRPAVVFLHGGWAFGDGDWEDAEPFAKAGFTLFMPTLRGENGNPGTYESFLGEVDDAIAAGRFVAALPAVDGSNVFVAGHSVGGVLTCLVSMLPSPYKGAAALEPFVLMQHFAAALPAEAEGVIVNMLDQRVWSITPHFVSYTVSKAGLWALTQSMALALAPRIRVCGIGPGPTLPSPRQTEAQFARQAASVPLGHGTTPEEIAGAVRMLLSLPSFTGQMLALDGGQHLQWRAGGGAVAE